MVSKHLGNIQILKEIQWDNEYIQKHMNYPYELELENAIWNLLGDMLQVVT